jgi:hypothetical protein
MLNTRFGPIGCALAAAVFAPNPGLAQAVSDIYPITLNLSHPSGHVSGDAKAVVLGQLTEDAIPDACVLHGTQAHLLRSVDRRNRWLALSGTYTAIALLPQGQSNGRDAVLAVGSGGLTKLVWNGGSGVETLVPQSVSGSSAWAGATQVQVSEDAGGDWEVLGLASDGLSILRWSFDPTNGAMADLGSVALDFVSTDLTPVDWDNGDDFNEYAVAGNWGYQVVDAAGDVLAGDVAECSDVLLLRMCEVGQADRLVWVFAFGDVDEFIQVLRPSSTAETPIYVAGNIDHMVLQDVMDDTRKELLLFADGLEFAVALRRSSTQTFMGLGVNEFCGVDLDHERSMVGGQFPDGTGVVGGSELKAPVPAVYDLDGDGDQDLLAAGHPGAAARAMVFLNRPINEESFGSTIEPIFRPWFESYTVTTDATADSVQVDFEIPALPATGPAASANRVRITFWTQAEGASHIDHASQQVFEYVLPLKGTPQVPTALFGDLAGLGDGFVHLETSYLQFSGSTMVAAYPAFHEKVALEWFEPHDSQVFADGTAGIWGSPKSDLPVVGGVGGTSGRPPSTPPSGGGG